MTNACKFHARTDVQRSACLERALCSLSPQDNASAQVDPASRLQSVVDEQGASVSRADVAARERTLLLEVGSSVLHFGANAGVVRMAGCV